MPKGAPYHIVVRQLLSSLVSSFSSRYVRPYSLLLAWSFFLQVPLCKVVKGGSKLHWAPDSDGVPEKPTRVGRAEERKVEEGCRQSSDLGIDSLLKL